jgi:hypothetical protein
MYAVEDVGQFLLAGGGQLVLVAADAGPAVGALVGAADGAVWVFRRRRAVAGLVQPAGLRHAEAVRPLVAVDGLQQRHLAGERQLALQADVAGDAPEEQAAGERQQPQVAGQVGPADRGRQPQEGAERQQVADAAERPARLPEQRPDPRRQRALAPPRARHVVALRQDAEAGAVQVVQVPVGLGVGGVQQPAEEGQPLLGGGLDVRGGEEAAPEGPGRPLLAAAEERPAHPALVVQGARQGQRQQQDVPLPLQPGGLAGEVERPVRVALELAVGDVVAAAVAAEPGEAAQELAGDRQQAGAEGEGLLVLGDGPAPGVVVAEQVEVPAAVRLADQVGRRHGLGVGRHREAALAPEPGPAGQELFPPGRRHGTLTVEGRALSAGQRYPIRAPAAGKCFAETSPSREGPRT